jgi:hypothetical protein
MSYTQNILRTKRPNGGVAKKPHFSNFQGQNAPNVVENRQIIKNDYLRKRKTKKNAKRDLRVPRTSKKK